MTKNPRTNETVTPSETEKTPRKPRKAEALRREIVRVATHLRSGGEGGDDGGGDI